MTWTLDDIAWDRFEAARVTPDLLRIAKAACLVEHNGSDYGTYLCSVFKGDSDFCDAAKVWAEEEVKHGQALRRWVEMVDPMFNFDDAFARFRAKIMLPLEADASVRGSLCRELIARCVVEVGTSSYYSALRDSADEPVFQEICRRIAGDEFRHYKLFYDHMRRYRAAERPTLLARLRTVVGRLLEAEDDELAYAYYCANGFTVPYRRSAFRRAYANHAFARYRPEHVELGANMVLKAVGLRPQSWYGRAIGRVLAWIAGLGAARMAKYAQAS
jgi:rubrerythrin